MPKNHAKKTLVILSLSLALGYFAFNASSNRINTKVGRNDAFQVDPDNKDQLPVYLHGKLVREYFSDKQWDKAENIEYIENQMYEILNSEFELTPAQTQKKITDNFRLKVYSNALDKGWFEYKKGIRDGFLIRDRLDPLHYVNQAYLLDGEMLNPEKPEVLMYYPTTDGTILAGVMFLMNGVDRKPPEIGADAYWHFHKWGELTCMKNGLPQGGVPCAEGEDESMFSPAMLHVWLVEHPKGPFSSDMCLPAEVLGEKINRLEYMSRISARRWSINKLQNEIHGQPENE